MRGLWDSPDYLGGSPWCDVVREALTDNGYQGLCPLSIDYQIQSLFANRPVHKTIQHDTPTDPHQ